MPAQPVNRPVIATRISICLCTFRRPILLDGLLQALHQQRLSTGMTTEVCVVDNDPAHSARDVLARWAACDPGWLRHRHLPVPNIAAARNATVAMAQGAWLAFIDDDETPQPDWLELLLNTARRHRADAVLGPVLPRYVPGTPHWLIEGRYFERRRLPTGTLIDEADARSGNVLVRADALAQLAGPFDEAFGRTGGEDSMLFRSLLQHGRRLVWCDEAPVSEEVPLARATTRWLLARSYRVGQTWIRAELYHRRGAGKWVSLLVLGLRAGVQCLLAALLALVWLPASRVRSFEWLRKAAANAGKLTGMSRMQYREYG